MKNVRRIEASKLPHLDRSEGNSLLLRDLVFLENARAVALI
jgi:hypothetical protein